MRGGSESETEKRVGWKKFSLDVEERPVVCLLGIRWGLGGRGFVAPGENDGQLRR